MAPGDPSKTQKEDSWAWVELGEPFPDGPMRVKGEQNQYVALWYKHGKPVNGRASNNGGVVECSFPYKAAELKTKEQLGGKIQILAYPFWKEPYDGWLEYGFTYKWVPLKERRGEFYQLVRCGDHAPILMKGDDGNVYAGDLELTTETVSIAYNGKTKIVNTGVGELLTIVRDIRDPRPPPAPPSAPPPPPVLEYFDVWVDLKEGDEFSRCRFPIKALDRPLKTPAGPKEHFVALWYKHGVPVCGRLWNEGGRIAASFASHGSEHTKKVGSLQVLVYNPQTAGFKLSWQPYSVATKKGSGWFAVRVKDAAPCIITDGGHEYLGNVKVKEESASYGYNGAEKVFNGPQVQSFMVLCRDSPVPGATE